MNNFFNNANLKVTPHKILHSTAMPDTSMFKVYESMMLEKLDNERVAAVENKMLNEKKQELQANIAANQMLESYLLNLNNQLYTEGKDVLFKDIMCDIFLESLYLDEDFKQENVNAIKSTMADLIDKNNGFSMLEEACRKEGTKLLKDMKEVVEKTARKCSMRKTSQLKEACKSDKHKGTKAMEVMSNKHNFDMDDEEFKEYTRDREKLSEDEIVRLVKDKVLDVIKDERDRQEELDKFEAEISEKAEELQYSEKEKEAFKESTFRRLSENTFVDMTLFEAIQFSTMKELLESTKHCCNDALTIEEYIDENDEESFDLDEDLLDEDDMLENGNSIDMDMVLAESITKYTLLELCHTMKLEKYNRDTIQNICLKLSK